MSSRWQFYDPATGLFSGRSYSGPAAGLSANTPPGLAAWQGVADHLAQRVDLATGEIVDYQPPSPGPDHEWDTATRRWTLTPAAAAAKRDAMLRVATIQNIEASQARIIREFILGDTTAKKRLQDLDADIAALRKQL